MNERVSVVVVAGGSGARFGSEIPKQFHLLNGQLILMRSLEAFYKSIPNCELILVLPENQFSFWDELCSKHRFEIPHKLVEGGTERFYSVKNGLLAVAQDSNLIAIHDGVRPLVSKPLIQRCLALASEKGASIPVIPLTDSVRMLNDREGGSQAVDRNQFVFVQTPQCFKRDVLMNAYEVEFSPTFTDDASVVEASGQPVYCAAGESFNIKITQPEDMALAEILDQSLNSGPR